MSLTLLYLLKNNPILGIYIIYMYILYEGHNSHALSPLCVERGLHTNEILTELTLVPPIEIATRDAFFPHIVVQAWRQTRQNVTQWRHCRSLRPIRNGLIVGGAAYFLTSVYPTPVKMSVVRSLCAWLIYKFPPIFYGIYIIYTSINNASRPQ